MSERRERGALESAVLRCLWDAVDPLTSRELRERFDERDRPALTTLLTVLERLQAKGLVEREQAAGGALFRAARSESATAASAMAGVLGGVHDREAALLQFAGRLDERDLVALRRAIERR